MPPGSEVFAGIRATSLHGQFGNYAFITNDNRIDLSDFIAITGSDESRIFNQVIFTASSGHDGKPVEHSILVSGHFDHDRIFRALSANETIIRYRDIAVLTVAPFERERSYFRLRRWLVFIGSSVAIFSTVASAKAEIDRSLAGSTPDEAILQRLARLQCNDEEWSLLPAIDHGIAVLHQLRLLDPTLANLAKIAIPWPSGSLCHYGVKSAVASEDRRLRSGHIRRSGRTIRPLVCQDEQNRHTFLRVIHHHYR